jgi:hypothetical protein
MPSTRANKIAREFRKIKEFTKVHAPVRESTYDVIELVFHSAWYNDTFIEERYFIKVPVSKYNSNIYVTGAHAGMNKEIREKAESIK